MIRLIAAIDSKRGIAKNGVIPWDLPSDKVYFREMTLKFGANVLMGRNTFEVIGDYLSGRHNFIVSHEAIELPTNCHRVNDLKEFLVSFKDDLWVIGGAEIYAQTISQADELYLTVIDHDFNCDKFFPDYTAFKRKTSEGPLHEKGLSFSYQVLIRF